MPDPKTPAAAAPEGRSAGELKREGKAKPAAPAVPADQAAQKIAPLTKSGKAEDAVAWLSRMMGAATVSEVRLPAFSNLDPSKPAQYKRFLEDPLFASARGILADRCRSWLRLLEEAGDVDELIETVQQRVEKISGLLDVNLKAAYEKIRPIEAAYRAADGYFMNAQAEPGEKVDAFFFNAHGSQLMDTDDRTLFENLAGEIQTEYRYWSLRKTYCNVVVPGWTGSVQALDRLGELGEANKVQIFTDADDFGSYTELVNFMGVDAFEGIRGNAPYKKYVSLFGNYLLGRPRHRFEEEDLWLPPSALLAGRLYYNDEHVGIQQCSAGYDYGRLTGPQAVRFRVDTHQAAKLTQTLGINPVVDFDGYPRVMGDFNLCNKAPLDSYSRIRTEDWILKNVFHYLHKQTYLTISNELLFAIESDIKEFLGDIQDKHGRKAITGSKVWVRATEEQKKNHEVEIDLEIEFLHTARHFNVKVLGDDRDKKDITVAEKAA